MGQSLAESIAGRRRNSVALSPLINRCVLSTGASRSYRYAQRRGPCIARVPYRAQDFGFGRNEHVSPLRPQRTRPPVDDDPPKVGGQECSTRAGSQSHVLPQLHSNQTAMQSFLPLALIPQDATPDSSASPRPTSLPPAVQSSAILDMLHNSGPTAITVLVVLLLPASFRGPSCWPSTSLQARRQAERPLPARLSQVHPPERDRRRRRAVQAQPAGRGLQ